MSYQRIIQALSLIIFLSLLTIAISDIFITDSLDLFLRLDPIAFLITVISSRTFSLLFIPALIAILITPLFGRIFCGYICPMGITLDCSDWIFSFIRKKQLHIKKLYRVKYIILIFLVLVSIFGISFVFFASPLSLITRFYGLLIQQLFIFCFDWLLGFIRPIAEKLQLTDLIMLQVLRLQFNTILFVLIFFLILFVCSSFIPRLWCRYLCPSGAILSLFSKKPLVRRFVNDDCIQCGKCSKKCPMVAIPDQNPIMTNYSECIVCHSCKNICPTDAIGFTGAKQKKMPIVRGFPITRRNLIITGFAGLSTGIVSNSAFAPFSEKSDFSSPRIISS